MEYSESNRQLTKDFETLTTKPSSSLKFLLYISVNR